MVEQEKQEDLEEELTHILEECRLVLPGIQALFGFQLVAVFNERFEKGLTSAQQLQHFVSILFITLAIIFVLTPAAYHRQAEPHDVSLKLVRRSTYFLMLGMIGLMSGICIDLALVADMILNRLVPSVAISIFFFLSFMGMWFVFPRLSARRRGLR
jgi:hypothetical protein